MKKVLTLLGLLTLTIVIVNSTSAQTTFTWNGGANGVWTSASNWSPIRSGPLPNDILVFNSGTPVVATGVPNQTLGTLHVTNGSFVDLRSSASVNLNATNVQVDNGSSLTFSSNGATAGPLINVNVSTAAQIRGTITMHYGTFSMQAGSTITLQGASPLNRVNGQFSLSSTTTLQIGTGINSPQVILPNNIFSSSPTIGNMIINNGNGISLGNQNITISNSLTLTSGSINSSSTGHMIFGNTATFPTESETAYIEGVAELRFYPVGTGGLSFMGLNISPGPDDLGLVSVLRRTGLLGVASFNGAQGVASTWEITSQNQPVSGRNISFGWVSAFDNTNLIDTRFQVYSYETGPSWVPVGPLQLLADNTNGLRVTSAITTTHFSSWTVTDENNPLPVTWKDFYGLPGMDDITLVWETASEKNTDYFILEKMHTNNEFAELSGRIKAAGNSNTVLSYSFKDTEPTLGHNYYRVKQVDYDGKYDHSKVISVYFSRETNGLYSVYPNPARQVMRIRRNFISQQEEQIQLVDNYGRVVFGQRWNNDNSILSLDNLALPAGMYRLIVKGEKGFYSQKVILD